MAQQTDQFGRIHEIGFDASGQPSSSGFYVVGPDGRIVLVQSIKPGWRIATQADLSAAAAKNAARQADEATASEARIAAEREASTARGELERAAAAENLQRAALKADAKAPPTVLAHAEPPHDIAPTPIASSSSPPAHTQETTGSGG